MVYKKISYGKDNYTFKEEYKVPIRLFETESRKTPESSSMIMVEKGDKRAAYEIVILMHAFDLNGSMGENMKKRKKVEKELRELIARTDRVVTLYGVLLLSKDQNTINAAFDKEEWLFNKIKSPGDKLSLDRDDIMLRIRNNKIKSRSIACGILQERCKSYVSFFIRQRDAYLISKLF